MLRNRDLPPRFTLALLATRRSTYDFDNICHQPSAIDSIRQMIHGELDCAIILGFLNKKRQHNLIIRANPFRVILETFAKKKRKDYTLGRKSRR